MAGTNGTEMTAVPSTLAEARDLMLQATARHNAEQYRLGRLYNRVVDEGMAGARTEESAQRYLGPQIKALSPKVLRLYGRVARHFSESVCVKYGLRRLGLLLRYVEKFGVEWTQWEPGLTPIEVLRDDGTWVRKRFVDCDVAELRGALTRERERPMTPVLTPVQVQQVSPPAVPRVDTDGFQILRNGMSPRLPKNTLARLYSRVCEGRLHVTLKRVSVAELEMLVGTIMESLEPLYEELHRRDEEADRMLSRRSHRRGNKPALPRGRRLPGEKPWRVLQAASRRAGYSTPRALMSR
jgi:hypothetical protein